MRSGKDHRGDMRFWVLRVLGVSMFFGLACSGGAWAEVSNGRVEEDPQVREWERRAESRGVALRGGERDASELRTKIEESEDQVAQMRVRVEELGDGIRELQLQSKAEAEDLAEARDLYEERIRAAYKGDDLEGVLSIIGGIVNEGSITVDSYTASVLLQSQDHIEQYDSARVNLENSMRQLEQKKEDYGILVKEERSRTADLQAQEQKLDEKISGLGESRSDILARIDGRLRQLEAAERADKLRKPVSGGEEKQEKKREIDLSENFVKGEDGLALEPVERLSEDDYMRLYRRAAREAGFGEDWYVLAAVGRVESNHGKYLGPSTSGALGPMQFMPSTWSTSGVDGNGDGKKNIMDPEDAIPAAAAYLKVGGAPNDWSAALYSYNHSGLYVKEVLTIAEDYRRRAGDKRTEPYI